MPFISAQRMRRLLWPALDRIGRRLVPTARLTGHAALLLLLVTGEAIRWVDYHHDQISVPLLRSVHAFGGFLLLAALLVRCGDPLVQHLMARLAPRRELLRRPAFQVQGRSWPDVLLDGAWWTVVGLLVLSGLERYTQLRHGTTLLPWLTPTAWWAVHRPLLPYLYAILLSNVLIRGRILYRRALDYLYTP